MLRKHLTTAIEIASLLSAVGIVISAITYSFIFYRFNLNYLGIASFGDIIRDSFRTLIVLATIVALLFPLVWLWWRRDERRSGLSLAAFVIGWTTVNFVVLILGMYISLAVWTPEDNPMTWKFGLVIAAAYVAVATTLYLGELAIRRAPSEPGRKLPDAVVITALGFVTFGFGIFFASDVLGSQIENGIPMVIHPLDKSLCGGNYSVSWLGESRMVVRCVKTGKFVVHLIN